MVYQVSERSYRPRLINFRWCKKIKQSESSLWQDKLKNLIHISRTENHAYACASVLSGAWDQIIFLSNIWILHIWRFEIVRESFLRKQVLCYWMKSFAEFVSFSPDRVLFRNVKNNPRKYSLVAKITKFRNSIRFTDSRDSIQWKIITRKAPFSIFLKSTLKGYSIPWYWETSKIKMLQFGVIILYKMLVSCFVIEFGLNTLRPALWCGAQA